VLKCPVLLLLIAMSTTCALRAQVISTIAGTGTVGYTTDIPPVPGATAPLYDPVSVAVNATGDVFVADFSNHRIRKIDHISGSITTVAGVGIPAYWGDGGPATGAAIMFPYGMDFDVAGNMYFCDFGNNVIRKISTSGIISTIAGIPGSPAAYTGDGGPATAARLANPMSVLVDLSGDIIISDQMNHALRKVDMTTGIISTIMGNGFIGMALAGDGGPASAAKLNYPHGIDMDAAGNLYIADYGNNRVRMISVLTGLVSTVAGIMPPPVGSIYGYSGDGGPATAAQINYPEAIAVDGPGNIYIADFNNHAIRKVNTAGIMETVAGIGTDGFSGDGGPATVAQLNYPTYVAVRSDGDFFIADKTNQRIRQVDMGNGPYFVDGDKKDVVICPTESTSLDTALRVNDAIAGHTLTWSPATLPAHGTLLVAYSTLSTGSTVTPSGTYYVAFPGYVGPDTFTVQVTDGTIYDTIEIIADITGPLSAGTITGADSVCPGQTITEVSSVAGGTWSSGNAATATVAADGVVTGIAAGTADITYTYTHHCGTYYAIKTVTVIATIPCVSSVAEVAANDEPVVVVPNPGQGHFQVTVNIPGITEAQLQIMDVTGRCLLKQRVPAGGAAFPFDIAAPPGIYMMMIDAADRHVVKRLLIQ